MNYERGYDKKPSFSGGGQSRSESLSQELLNKIKLSKPEVDLFDSTASSCAQEISDSDREKNKSTQLRRFYDEICQWHEHFDQNPESFDKSLPLVRMLNAKVAYAEGRKLVDKKFSSFMQHCLREVKDRESFNNFKLFFEAFLGFYKARKG